MLNQTSLHLLFVSMPSRASISLLHLNEEGLTSNRSVSMPSRASISLLPHAGTFESPIVTVNVSMPSRASISLLQGLISDGICNHRVSMPSRASISLLQYPFKNLGFMRFPEPVFAGICQNILTVAHFHAC